MWEKSEKHLDGHLLIKIYNFQQSFNLNPFFDWLTSVASSNTKVAICQSKDNRGSFFGKMSLKDILFSFLVIHAIQQIRNSIFYQWFEEFTCESFLQNFPFLEHPINAEKLRRFYIIFPLYFLLKKNSSWFSPIFMTKDEEKGLNTLISTKRTTKSKWK